MHYYKRNIGDYAKKCGRLTMLQHGAYTLLIDSCYDREAFPTLDDAIEWTWASSREEIEAVTFVLRKFFTLQDGVYVQKRIQEELNEYQGKADVNRRIALEREAKRRGNITNRARDVNEPPPNQEPLTINQEPIDTGTNVPIGKADRLPPCNSQSIVDLYHTNLPELPAVRLMSDKRQKSISSFWKFVLTSKKTDGTPRAVGSEEALEWIGAYFQRARSNDFLMGLGRKSDGHEGWQCDFDFLLSNKGRVQVIEKTQVKA